MKQALVESTAIKEGVEQQFTGALIGPQTQGTREFGEAQAGAELPEEQESANAKDRRQD
jgi:hypothetical protein